MLKMTRRVWALWRLLKSTCISLSAILDISPPLTIFVTPPLPAPNQWCNFHEYVYIIDQARGQDGWILAEFSFCVKRKTRTRSISSHLDRTSLVNKRFIVWHKEHWKKWSSYLFIFAYWKGTQLNAKVIARAPISWLDKCRKYNHLIGYTSNSKFKFKVSNSKQTFVFNLPVFAAKGIFQTLNFEILFAGTKRAAPGG